jgi:beta-glucosidase
MKYVTGAKNSDVASGLELKNRRIAYEAATEGIVLLSNDGTLPLNVGKIAVYGTGALYTIKGGTGSGEVNERYSVSILEGLKNAGFVVTTDAWLADCAVAYEAAKAAHFEKIKKGGLKAMFNIFSNSTLLFPAGREITESDIVGSDTDTALYVVSRQAGEGGDRKLEKYEYTLTDEEISHILTLSRAYKHTVLCINCGSSMDISGIDGLNVSAVVNFNQQGEEGGNALADVLSGKVTPSGKLTDTWARTYADIYNGDEYSYLSGDTTKEFYREGIYVGYRYFDTFEKPCRYPFGFGLSYTTFDIHTNNVTLDGGNVKVDVTVTNTGSCSGKEVVQVYVVLPDGKLKKEYQRLVGFAKTETLEAGERQTLQVSFDVSYLTSFCEECSATVLEAGSYVVMVGNSSQDNEAVAVVNVDKTTKLVEVKNNCPVQTELKEIDAVVRTFAGDISALPTLQLKSDSISTAVIDYSAKKDAADTVALAIMAKLSVRDMAEICVGAGLGGMFSTKKIVTLGAVGRTTDKLYKKGLINVNLCDGPAGVRILRRAAIRGRLKMVDYLHSVMEFLPRWLLKPLLANPQKDETLYQFCTAFPVGTALAQSWNTPLCEAVGAAVGEEMDAYNGTFWLAPAQNIHRNPLCGRNFEYFSEDPVLSGKMSASLTRGVQSVEGVYATIKHFACNNQEDNRNKCDSIVSVRALREIYLRGFEICVKEAAPKSVMTSYNLLNGVYTPNSRHLVTDVLRREWGFTGVVMTDWYSTGKKLAQPDQCIAAGNDLIMPGSGWNKRSILKGLKSGNITKEQLAECAKNVVKLIVKSNMAKRYRVDDFE